MIVCVGGLVVLFHYVRHEKFLTTIFFIKFAVYGAPIKFDARRSTKRIMLY